MANEILVIRYKETFTVKVFGADAYYRWAVCRVSNYKGRLEVIPTEVTRARAKEIIREYGLVLAHKDDDGAVYDTEDRSFQSLYGKSLIRISEVKELV